MNVVSRENPCYPSRLREVPDAPAVLYVAGLLTRTTEIDRDRRPVVAIVGARAASGHARALAWELANSLSAQGALIVSGGAVGVDAAAHRGALAADAPTWVVLAGSVPYPPQHQPLYDEVLARGGALLSPFQPGVPLRRWHFPRRNEVMAGIADAVVVVEAGAASGSLYTARAAVRYDRVLAACPGSAGSEALLARGAALVQDFHDVLAALQGAPRRVEMPLLIQEGDEARALAALDFHCARAVDDIGSRSGLALAETVQALCSLELEGLAVPVPGGLWIRTAVAQSSQDRMISRTTNPQDLLGAT